MLKQYPVQSDVVLVKRKARAMSTTSHGWVILKMPVNARRVRGKAPVL